VVLYNADGFWNDVTAMLDGMRDKGFLRGKPLLSVVDNIDDLKRTIMEA
jgi:hypothetical protein